jgi:vacuolar-type H+-ATPase subunit H
MAPETQNAADLHVVPNSPGNEPQEALGLLGHARRVADETMSQAQADAEQVLASAREEAASLQREARARIEQEIADAGRKAQSIRNEAHGEAERVVGGANQQIAELKRNVERLRTERAAAVEQARAIAGKLLQAADAGSAPAESDKG